MMGAPYPARLLLPCLDLFIQIISHIKSGPSKLRTQNLGPRSIRIIPGFLASSEVHRKTKQQHQDAKEYKCCNKLHRSAFPNSIANSYYKYNIWKKTLCLHYNHRMILVA